MNGARLSYAQLAQRVQQTFAFGRINRPIRKNKEYALFVCLRRTPLDRARITLSQFQLFIDERDAIEREYHLTPVFCFSDETDKLSNGLLSRCAVIGLQTEFTEEKDAFEQKIGNLRRHRPDARIIYFDHTAPTDLRLASVVNDYVDLFVKKHVLRDRSQYGQQTLGDTNLIDYYARKFGLSKHEVLYPIPDAFFDKLIIGPSFFTDYNLRRAFESDAPAISALSRTIDVQARFAVDGTDWYAGMRNAAAAAVSGLPDSITVKSAMTSKQRYLSDLKSAKTCFSPFGYGEICWRDFEAFGSGAALIKPDVSNVELAFDCFIPGQTYVPVAWDFEDAADKISALLSDNVRQEMLSQNAFQIIADYFREQRFKQFFDAVFLGMKTPEGDGRP